MKPFPIGTVIYTPADAVETVLADAAHALAARGVRLGGMVQRDLPGAADDPCAMELENLETGVCIPLSQDLGACSLSCRVDPDALAQGSVAIRGALSRGAQLVVANKFGALEVGGAGLRDDMASTVLAGVPLLTAVGARFLPAWTEFTGGEFTALKPEVDDVLAWWDALQAETDCAAED